MVEADFSGDFLNTENCKDGDIAEFTGEGQYVEREVDYNGKKSVRKILNLPILINGKERIYSPGRDSGRKLVALFGKETKNWVGKKAQAKYVNYKSFGQTKTCVELEPIAEEKV